jgi:carbonic anhydrase/acetyltransferase-like protein (isoleucine patch superfamily)
VEIEHRGQRPSVHPSAYVAPTAVLCGNVTIGAGARVLFGAVLSAEDGAIEVGENCVVMENALVRGRERHPARIANDVLVGPHAHVNGAEVGAGSFIATGASLFPGARLGKRCELRIHAIVHVNTVLAPDTMVPIGWIAAGDPAQLFSPDRHDELWKVQQPLDFPGTVYGVDRGTDHSTLVRAQADWFGAHRDDRVL